MQNGLVKTFAFSDFWARLFEWHALKILSVFIGILSSVGLFPVIINVVKHNEEKHIRYVANSTLFVYFSLVVMKKNFVAPRKIFLGS